MADTDFCVVHLTLLQAEEILKCEECCQSESQGGDIDFLLVDIAEAFPSLKEKYKHLYHV
jgi:hypothetical protein